MNSAVVTQGLQIASVLFKLGSDALERSDSETAKAILGFGKKVMAGIETSGRIDEAVANDIYAMEAQLDADGVLSADAWKELAEKVRTSAARWNAAG